MNAHVNITQVYTYKCVYLLYILNNYTPQTHVYYANTNFYFVCDYNRDQSFDSPKYRNAFWLLKWPRIAQPIKVFIKTVKQYCNVNA